MKPELVSYSFGRHNEWIEASTKRLSDGALWKRQRVVIVIPADTRMSSKVALSHWNLVMPPNQAVTRILAIGAEVGEAYSNAIAEILKHPDLSQWEYVLTIEADNIPPPDGLVRLISHMDKHPEFACIGGTYFTKGEGGVCQRWGDPRDQVLNFRPMPPPSNDELAECCGTGMGFNLWRLSMFKDERLRRPWFKTLNGSEGQGVGTQDLYAWADFRKNGYRCAIAGDVRVGHHDLEGKFGPPDMVW